MSPDFSSAEKETTKVLTAKDITIELPGGRELVKNFSLTINPNDKIGVIGEEGNGKSTLLKVLAGIKQPDFTIKGETNSDQVNIGYLPQFLPEDWDTESVTNFFLKEKSEDEISWERYNDLPQVAQAISEVGLDPKIIINETYDMPMSELSGGEKVRLELAKILIADPDVLLLDEPTNDVDLSFLIWFEKFIQESNKGIAIISHDETLLERATNRIVHLEQTNHRTKAKHTKANINFAEYAKQRIKSIDTQTNEAKRQRRELKESLETARQQKSSVRSQQESTKDSTTRRLLNKKMKTVKKVETKLLSQELTEVPDIEEAIKFEFPETAKLPAGKRVADWQLDELVVQTKKGPRLLAENLELAVTGPEKIAITGKNGSGKTTLLKQLKDHIKNDIGLEVGYFPQNYAELLADPDKPAKDYLVNPGLGVDETYARTCLGRLKFSSEEMTLPVSQLSGGQKAKLVLLKLMLDGSQVLLLDEASRNLSPLSNPVIRQAFRDFPGAIVAVSHDRKFIDQIAGRALLLDQNGLQEIDKEKIEDIFTKRP